MPSKQLPHPIFRSFIKTFPKIRKQDKHSAFLPAIRMIKAVVQQQASLCKHAVSEWWPTQRTWHDGWGVGGILLSCLSVGEYGRPLVWLGGPVFFQGWKEKCTCWSLVRRHLWSTLTDIKASTRGSRKWFKSVYTRTSYTRALLYSIQRVRQEDWSGYCVESFFQLAWVSGESKIEALL